MANVTKAHGVNVAAGQFIGREFQGFTIDKSDADTYSQLEVNLVIQTLQLYGTVEIVGAFTPDVSASFRVLMSGCSTAAGTLQTALRAAGVSAGLASMDTKATVADFAF